MPTNVASAMNSPRPLDDLFASLLQRRALQNRFRQLTVPAPDAVDFSSNGYLCLATNRQVQASFLSRLQQQPSLALGSGGSRLLDGNTSTVETLEASIAAFHGAAAGLIFNSGFDANTGLFGCVPQPGDVVVYDELIHASVHDGLRLGRAQQAVAFAHNCVTARPVSAAGVSTTGVSTTGVSTTGVSTTGVSATGVSTTRDTNSPSRRPSLDKVLAALSDTRHNVFVAVESVYSMDGDLAPLQDIVACVERRLPRGNGYLVVDEAHATGWLGKNGQGLVSHLGLQDKVWARIHTFGKALGCGGAIILSSPMTRSYLVNYARSFIYTTALGFPSLAAIEAVYDYLASGRVEPHVQHLYLLMRHTHDLVASVCARHQAPPSILRIGSGPPQSPIIPLFTVRARQLARHCQDQGFTVRPIVAPTVPLGTDRVRLCLHAGNTLQEVQALCCAIEQWLCQELDNRDSSKL